MLLEPARRASDAVLKRLDDATQRRLFAAVAIYSLSLSLSLFPPVASLWPPLSTRS